MKPAMTQTEPKPRRHAYISINDDDWFALRALAAKLKIPVEDYIGELLREAIRRDET